MTDSERAALECAERSGLIPCNPICEGKMLRNCGDCSGYVFIHTALLASERRGMLRCAHILKTNTIGERMVEGVAWSISMIENAASEPDNETGHVAPN